MVCQLKKDNLNQKHVLALTTFLSISLQNPSVPREPLHTFYLLFPFALYAIYMPL